MRIVSIAGGSVVGLGLLLATFSAATSANQPSHAPPFLPRGVSQTANATGNGSVRPHVRRQDAPTPCATDFGGNANGSGYFIGIPTGADDIAGAQYSVVGGGEFNNACGEYSGGVAGRENSLSQNATYSVIGGGFENTVYGSYSFVGGGSLNTVNGEDASVGSGFNNTANGENSSVSGGYYNTVDGSYSFIGGGNGNSLGGVSSVIGAGFGNQMSASSEASGIAAGEANTMNASGGFIGAGGYLKTLGNSVEAYDAFVGAGDGNVASGAGSVVAGGGTLTNNSASASRRSFNRVPNVRNRRLAQTSQASEDGNSASGEDAFLGAGDRNQVSGLQAFLGSGLENAASGEDSAIAGGFDNTSAALESVVGGGEENSIASAASYGTIAGGVANSESGTFDAILGGKKNVVSSEYASILGGFGNTASGAYAAVVGGNGNTAAGELTFAGGYHADATNNGSFVWSDFKSGSAVVSDTAANQFVARASGGVTFYSNEAATAGVSLSPGSGTWASLSDRNAKTAIAPLDDASVLAKVSALPVSTWSYKSETGVRHVGPMAQDFYAAFGVGADPRHITSIDEDGVALAAIKALSTKLVQRDSEILRHESEIVRLHAQNAGLQQRLARLEQKVDALSSK